MMKIRNMMRRERGFTLIELLIVVAIIGIIAALLIPNFLESLQKAKQKRTMADARNVGTAMMAWLTDEAGAAAAGEPVDGTTWGGTGWAEDWESVAAELVPRYVQDLPKLDGWKNPFCYALNTEDPLALNVMAVFSGGRDSDEDCTSFPDTITPATTGGYDPAIYDNDILWAEGTFLVWPEKATSE